MIPLLPRTLCTSSLCPARITSGLVWNGPSPWPSNPVSPVTLLTSQVRPGWVGGQMGDASRGEDHRDTEGLLLILLPPSSSFSMVAVTGNIPSTLEPGRLQARAGGRRNHLRSVEPPTRAISLLPEVLQSHNLLQEGLQTG